MTTALLRATTTTDPAATKSSPGWGLREGLFVPVVGAALDDLDHVAINAVDDPVCIVDAAAPIAGQIAAEALGLADALIAVAVDVLQEGIDSSRGLSVLRLLMQIVVPGVIVPGFDHASSLIGS